MDVGEASSIIANAVDHDYGNFYGGALQDQPLGVGLIYHNIRYPIIDHEELVYDTVEGLVYILTHECDIAVENIRPFNDLILICPIIPLESCHSQLSTVLSVDDLRNFYNELARDNISRVSYMPPLAGLLPNGGIIYLNQVTHTHIEAFQAEGVVGVTSLTANGLRIIDYKVANHLLRPKAANLSLMRY